MTSPKLQGSKAAQLRSFFIQYGQGTKQIDNKILVLEPDAKTMYIFIENILDNNFDPTDNFTFLLN